LAGRLKATMMIPPRQYRLHRQRAPNRRGLQLIANTGENIDLHRDKNSVVCL
jgi:hypothetical protein